MFNLSRNCKVVRPLLNYDFFQYIPPSLKIANGEKSQSFINIPLEDSANSLKDSCRELDSFCSS